MRNKITLKKEEKFLTQSIQNIFSSIVFMVISVVIYFVSDNIQSMTSMGLGPDFFPKVTSIIVLILNLYLLIQEIIKRKKKKEQKFGKKEIKNIIKVKLLNRVYLNASITIIILILYVYLISKIGFSLSSIAYLLVHFFILGERKAWNVILFVFLAFIVSLAIFYTFRLGFSVRLPTM